MRRYKNIQQKEIYESWNSLRNALLAAQNGNEVNKIMDFLFTDEEKFQLGRRIIIAGFLRMGVTIDEIAITLRVGKNTVLNVLRRLDSDTIGYELIEKRNKKVEEIYSKGKYRKTGGSKLVFKKKEYTGLKRVDVKR